MIMLVADMKQNKTSFTPTRSEKTPTTTSSLLVEVQKRHVSRS
jgi:hypothetical protein